jgi:hypothetical protein
MKIYILSAPIAESRCYALSIKKKAKHKRTKKSGYILSPHTMEHVSEWERSVTLEFEKLLLGKCAAAGLRITVRALSSWGMHFRPAWQLPLNKCTEC